MALINCKECGQQISDSATVCPHCGAPVIKEVYCVRCGEKIPQNVKYCPKCGEPNRQAAVNKKDRVTAGLLAIFIGWLGIHYFYLNKPTAGILTIVLSLFTCGIWQVVMLIQGIIMLTMTDEDFNQKYCETDKSFPLF